VDAADADDRQRADALAHLREALGRGIKQRLAREAAGFGRILHPGDRIAADSGVGDDEAIEIGGGDDGCDAIERRFIEIGRDLEEDRHPHLGLGALGQHGAEQALQRFVTLQVPEARRIGRGDVDREVIGQLGEAPDAQHIVGDEVFAVLVGADIDAERRRHANAAQPFEGRVVAFIVKAHAVDDAFGLRNAEQARLGIAHLRARRHRTDLDHAEAHQRERTRDFGVLVEARCHADRVGKFEAAELSPEFGRIGDNPVRARGRGVAR
jgi:hypothetical protein